MQNKQTKIRRSAWFYVMISVITVTAIIGATVAAMSFNFHTKATETAKVKITDIYISEKLEEISELTTYTFEYTNRKEITNTRELWGWEIPFTTNEVAITYNGRIKAGYEMDSIQIKADDDAQKIYVNLPQAEIFDNYIDLDSLEIEEKNNIFNPVHVDYATSYFQDIEDEELRKAEQSGLYERAEEQAKNIIRGIFSEFPEYEVIFR